MTILAIGDIGVTAGVIHIGDEAMFEAAVDELAARGSAVTGISSAPEESARRYGIRSIRRLGFTGLAREDAERRAALLRQCARGEAALARDDPAAEVLDALDGATGVLIAGGGNLASRWPVHVFERTTLAAMAAARGVAVAVSGQTFGPDLDPDDARRVAEMTRAAVWTGTREHPSADLARSWGARVRVGVDDASFLGGGPTGEPSGGTVLVSLSGWFAGRPADAVESAVARALDAVADGVGPVVFHAHFGPVLPGAPSGDAALHERVRARMRRPSEVVPSGDSRSAARLARTARLLVTSRYHPAVFAAPAGVPVLGLAADDYTRIKLTGALAHWGQDAVLDLDDLVDAPAAAARLDAASPAIAERAAELSPGHRARAAAWWDDVASALS
ncbi:polysaccharide pyruvyl transferase family protein [Microbacterium sp. SS28]|uniref:polysaccharide pyruvyl transferase family protein n=1 Tax=Microbacterium sp. SS28 TaxID=2919948 RepID=UPI001FAA25BA|nr:polysaccharide pyruvyl transferase family protein [Microbacterium sp. SS28]